MTNRINKNIYVLADQVVFSGGGFVITMLLARLLGANNFGVFASLTLFNYSLTSILNAVVINPFQVSFERINNKRSYMFFNFWSQLLLVILVLTALQTVVSLKLNFLREVYEMGAGLLLFIFGFLMQDYFRKLFLAQSKVYEALLIDTITTGITLSVLVFDWFQYTHSLKVTVLYMGIAYIPSIIVAVIFIKPTFNHSNNWLVYLKMHYQQGKWLLLTTLTQWWSGNLFIVASGMYLGVKALGAFRLVQSLFGILNMILQTLENYALPEATRRYVQSKHEAKAYLQSITMKSSLLFGAVLLLLFLFSKQVILLAGGAQYADYAYVVKGMTILYLFIFIGYPVRMAVRMLLLNKSFFTGSLYAFIFSILSFNFLLSNWNIYGAILGLIISQIIVLVYWQFILRKKEFILWK